MQLFKSYIRATSKNFNGSYYKQQKQETVNFVKTHSSCQ